MATKNKAEATPSVTVVRRYQARGECRELGIHCIPSGYVDVEELSDGSLRIASADADMPLEPEPTEPEPVPESAGAAE